jgi:hypothetical protein
VNNELVAIQLKEVQDLALALYHHVGFALEDLAEGEPQVEVLYDLHEKYERLSSGLRYRMGSCLMQLPIPEVPHGPV